MGENALREDRCNFPGLGQYYDEVIDQADPAKPVEPGPQPEQPKFPPEPTKPVDVNDLLALQKYLNELTVYTNSVSKLRQDYETKLKEWQNEQLEYKSQLESYQENLVDLEVKRAIAVGSAESSIQRYKDDFGWAFINKDNRKAYLKTLFGTWGAQLSIILVLFMGTVIMQKRREVH